MRSKWPAKKAKTAKPASQASQPSQPKQSRHTVALLFLEFIRSSSLTDLHLAPTATFVSPMSMCPGGTHILLGKQGAGGRQTFTSPLFHESHIEQALFGACMYKHIYMYTYVYISCQSNTPESICFIVQMRFLTFLHC